MFSIFTKKDHSQGAFEFLSVDMHSHLLPAVDDGSDSVETSLRLIDGLKELGFSKLITTPHIYQAFYPNSLITLEPAYQNLKASLPDNCDLQYAAEYFGDEFFEDKVEREELLTFGERHVLVEISFVAYSQRIEHIIFDLVTKGYKPILAHPERYVYLGQKFNTFRKLKELGCLLQLNISSLGGYYGKASQELAEKLMKENMADFLGTDLHHDRHLEFLRKIGNDRRLMKSLRNYSWHNQSL